MEGQSWRFQEQNEWMNEWMNEMVNKKLISKSVEDNFIYKRHAQKKHIQLSEKSSADQLAKEINRVESLFT